MALTGPSTQKAHMSTQQPEALRLADALGYNNDGTLFWRVAAGNGRIKPGTAAGYPTRCGGIKVMFMKKAYWAHHIVWLMHKGRLPDCFIDHINGNRADNRIENLRPCDQSENMQNLKAKSIGAYGLRGVHKYRGGKWASAITKRGVKKWLGVFDTPEDALAAYTAAKREIHTFNPEVRK